MKLYKVLDLDKNASEQEIKMSFFKLAKKYHPDVNKEPDAHKRYLEINEAYQTLGDPEKRSVYDATGMSANDQDGNGFNFDGFGSFGSVLKHAFNCADAADKAKSYEEVLEEYEKFFSLDEEILKQEAQSKRKGGSHSSQGSRSVKLGG